MSIISDPRNRGMGQRFHGYGGGSIPQLVSPDVAVSFSVANGPNISLGNTTVLPAAAVSTTTALNPSITVGGVTLTPASAVSTSVAKTPSVQVSNSAAFVQDVTIYPYAPQAYNVDNNSGNFLIAVCSWRGGAAGSTNITADPSISDSQGNTWIPLTKLQSSGILNGQLSVAMKLFYCENCAGGPNTVTLGGVPGSDSDFGMTLYEFTGIRHSGSLDTGSIQVAPNVFTTTPTAASFTTTQTDFLFIAYADEKHGQGTITAQSGYTLGLKNQGHADAQEYKLNVAPGTYTPLFNTSGTTKGWLIYALAFIQA